VPPVPRHGPVATTALRCAVYLRVSLDPTGEGLAVERQRQDCERLARQGGWTVTQTYTDNSISATDRTKVRPAYDGWWLTTRPADSPHWSAGILTD